MSRDDETIVKRLQLRLYSESDNVKDDAALVETLVVRHLDRLESLSRDCMKSWVISALKNQYLLEMGGNKVAATNITPATNGSISGQEGAATTLEESIDEKPTAVDNWLQDPSAAESMSIM